LSIFTDAIKDVCMVAQEHAEAVDKDGRFPGEAIEAMKRGGLMGVLLSGKNASRPPPLAEISGFCRALGRSCASTAMIFAMHHLQVATLAAAAGSSAWLDGFLKRIGEEQLLLAGSTTESGSGGDVRSSICALARGNDRVKFNKDASVISYGLYADAILVTARRDESAGPSDQAIVVLLSSDLALSPARKWRALGMRGTCSDGYRIQADIPDDRVIAVPYDAIHRDVVLPVSHLLWSGVWLGIASEASETAQRFLRSRYTSLKPRREVALWRLTEMQRAVGLLENEIEAFLSAYLCENKQTPQKAAALKLNASELALSVVEHALSICGIAGYREDDEFSISRNLRDVLSAPLMIHNDRLRVDGGAGLLLGRT
jgi:acyl-CoA dehydrogenase